MIKNSQLDSVKDIHKAYLEISSVFRMIEHNNSTKAWVHKADLLDALDILIDKFPHAQLKPIEIIPPKIPIRWAKGAIPIIPYSKLENATKHIQNSRTKNISPEDQVLRSRDDLQQILLGIAEPEYSGKSGDMIRILTKQKFSSAEKVFGAFYRTMTSLIGFIYKSPNLTGSNIKKIAKASKAMGIAPIEVLSRKLVDDKGEVFFYRGPRYLFNANKSIHEYRTVDEWFGRDLTRRARKDYLNKVRILEKSITNQYGPDQDRASRIVISNSDCRIRVTSLENFVAPQEIVGKVLSKEAALHAEQNQDTPIYYQDTYLFNVKNLLRMEKDDNLTPHLMNSSKIESFKQEKIQVKKKKNTKAILKRHESLLIDAQKELLATAARTFQEEGAIQVIQRLAPADVHNYVSAITGTPLSLSQASDYFFKRLEESEGSEKEKDYEKRLFDQLIEVFNKQNELLDRNSQTTIDIYGGLTGNSSVQTNAIANMPSILSQNDRKIMFFRHEDGQISMHVFIGATGVNRVNVNIDSIQMTQGQQQGDMRPGKDTYKKTNVSFKSSSKETRDGIKKVRIGERQGSFDKTGSTVISYYLPSDFTILPSIEAYKKVAIYQGTVNRKFSNRREKNKKPIMNKEVEILCKMGDPLLIKTEIALAKYLEQQLSLEFINSYADIVIAFNKIEDIAPEHQKLHALLLKIFNDPELTPSQKNLKKKLSIAIHNRIELIKAKNLQKQKRKQAKILEKDYLQINSLTNPT